MLHEAKQCGCTKDIPKSKFHIPHLCDHGNLYLYTKALGRSTSPSNPSRAARKPMKRGKGFAASKEQREKVEGLPCANCGREASDWVVIDPAHLWPRGKGGCDDPLCVIPLCRLFALQTIGPADTANGSGCHRALDEGKLDLLPKLIDNGYFKEMAHAIEAHELSPLTLLERTTGRTWVEADRSKLDGADQTGGGTENSLVPKADCERETGEVAA